MATFRIELKPFVDIVADDEDDMWAKFYDLDPDRLLPDIRVVEVIDG